MIFLALSIVGSIVAAAVASSKQRNALGWGIFGFVLPVIAVVAIACVSKRESSRELIDHPSGTMIGVGNFPQRY